MDDLVTWLRAQIDEDEREAAGGGSWTAVEVSPARATWEVVKVGGVVAEATERDACHIARHDPARVLAEVAAKRAVVDMASALLQTMPNDPAAALMFVQAGGHILGHLANVYADRDGYRDEWRP